MDGRLVIEDGDDPRPLELLVGDNRWEDRRQRPQGVNKGKINWHARCSVATGRRVAAQRRPPLRPRQRALRLFLEDDMQYSCGYSPTRPTAWSRRRLDKKAHIAAKLHLKPGQRVLDIGCGWGGMALYLNRVAEVDVLGVTLSEEQLQGRPRARRGGRRRRPGQVRADRLSRRVDGRVRPDRLGRHVRACRRWRIIDEFFAKCRELLAEDGVMLLHTIGKFGKAGAARPVHRQIYLPRRLYAVAVREIAAASEQVRLITSDVEMLRLHYALHVRALAASASPPRDRDRRDL